MSPTFIFIWTLRLILCSLVSVTACHVEGGVRIHAPEYRWLSLKANIYIDLQILLWGW